MSADLCDGFASRSLLGASVVAAFWGHIIQIGARHRQADTQLRRTFRVHRQRGPGRRGRSNV